MYPSPPREVRGPNLRVGWLLSAVLTPILWTRICFSTTADRPAMPALEHIGIAVEAPDAVADLYHRLLEVTPYKTETVAEQGVRTHFLAAGTAKLELLEALGPDSPVAKYVERHGEGLHHLAFEVSDIDATMARLREIGFTPLSDAPRDGADGKRIFFLHPKETHGVLVEFCQSVPVPPTPVRIPYRDGHLAAYEAGAPEAPPLLLLHGAAGCTMAETRPLMRRLEPHYRVLAVDFSGHGASTLPASPFSAALFVDNALAALDHFGVETADVFGFSMGGSMALLLAAHHPDRVRRLALHGAHIHWTEARAQAMTARLNSDAIAARPAMADQLAAVHADWPALFEHMRAFVATLPERASTMIDLAARVQQSTLVSAADQDELFPRSSTLDLERLLPNAHLALLPGTRHALPQMNLNVLVPLLRAHFAASG